MEPTHTLITFKDGTTLLINDSLEDYKDYIDCSVDGIQYFTGNEIHYYLAGQRHAGSPRCSYTGKDIWTSSAVYEEPV